MALARARRHPQTAYSTTIGAIPVAPETGRDKTTFLRATPAREPDLQIIQVDLRWYKFQAAASIRPAWISPANRILYRIIKVQYDG